MDIKHDTKLEAMGLSLQKDHKWQHDKPQLVMDEIVYGIACHDMFLTLILVHEIVQEIDVKIVSYMAMALDCALRAMHAIKYITRCNEVWGDFEPSVSNCGVGLPRPTSMESEAIFLTMESFKKAIFCTRCVMLSVQPKALMFP